jgi:hypothetical protein
MAKDNSKILSLIENGKTSDEIRKITRAPMMRIAGVRAAHTRYSSRKTSTPPKLATRKATSKIELKAGSDAHRLVTALLKLQVDGKTIAKASGNSTQVSTCPDFRSVTL